MRSTVLIPPFGARHQAQGRLTMNLSSSRPPLQDQAAVVTGASSGIGKAIAIELARAGADVAVNYRSSESGAEDAAQQVRALGRDAIAVPADVADEKEVGEMFSACIERFGRLDIVVANAGIQMDAPATEMSLKEWQTVLDVNLTGQFLCARAAIRHFLSRDAAGASKARGKIICISSVHETIPWAGRVNYAASKGGVDLMMRTLAQETAGQKIRINSIAPGAIKTGINEAVWRDPKGRARLESLIPYGRIGEPEDVARAAVWLASDDSDYVTGATIFVDGGLSLYPSFRERD